MVAGTHYDCYVRVTDAYSNAGTLHITTFTAGNPYQGPGDSGVGANITITTTKTNPAVTKTTTTTTTVTPTTTTTTTTQQVQNPAGTNQLGPITLEKPLSEMNRGELLSTLIRLMLALRSM